MMRATLRIFPICIEKNSSLAWRRLEVRPIPSAIFPFLSEVSSISPQFLPSFRGLALCPLRVLSEQIDLRRAGLFHSLCS
jgi:hypothetical protein